MMKRKLRIEDLAVESFVVSDTDAGARGTVRGFDVSVGPATLCLETRMLDVCQPTHAYSCIQTNCSLNDPE
jgi:hypothetical protein